jgi:hypothetical protein
MSQVAKSASALECAFLAILLELEGMVVRSFRPLNWQSLDFACSLPAHTRSSRSGLSGPRTSHQRFAELSIGDCPTLGKYALTSAPALFRLNLHSGDRPMIFLRRLGIVLNWVGYALAMVFAIVSLLYALNGLTRLRGFGGF